MNNSLIHTIVSEEWLWNQQSNTLEYEVTYGGILMDIIKEANGQKKIIRIYSTNPQAYLVFQPSQMIQDGNESVR